MAKLSYIDPYLAGKFAFLRFNFTTGDAAGQNMVGRATFAASSWILDNYEGIRHFYLEFEPGHRQEGQPGQRDAHARQARRRRSHGQAGCADPAHARQAGAAFLPLTTWPTSATILSGANNNGAHSANGITAMFIATGQDVANVAESSAGILYAELTKTTTCTWR